MKTTLLEIPVAEELRDEAAEICEELGISLPAAIQLFLKRLVLVKGIPFPMKMPKRDYKAEQAVQAARKLSEEAARNGTANMTMEEIDAEIAIVRAERYARAKRAEAELNNRTNKT